MAEFGLLLIIDLNHSHLMNLWSNVHPHQSECLLQCLSLEGRHEPAAHQVRQMDCGHHALQYKRQTIIQHAEPNMNYLTCVPSKSHNASSPLVPKLIIMSALPSYIFLKVKGVTSAQTFSAFRIALSTSDCFRSGV